MEFFLQTHLFSALMSGMILRVVQQGSSYVLMMYFELK